jgi:amino acid adenylation domain-containing protein/thioester reductase-like protein
VTTTFFEAWAPAVARDGAARAVEAPDGAVTRAELWAWAGAVAARLGRAGAGPGARVGLGLEMSAAYVAALLGAWRAGAAFVPLAPSLPEGRRRAALAQASPAVVVDAAWVGAARPAGRAASPAVGGAPRLDPLAPAYVMFTSGSAGAPKGVVVAHRGLVNVLGRQVEAFGLGDGARALPVLSTAFDASVSDVGTALLAGATLVIAPADETRDGPALLGALGRRAISHVDLPPAFLRALDPASCPPGLRTVVIGGEPCPPEVVRAWAARVRVVNVYGPTEATICTSLCACDPATWTRPLLGRPLAGVEYRVLDGAGRPAGEGASGELYIGGECLALGYWGRPDLTAERFVTLDGRRFYRTGDRVIVRAGGELEFAGRIDRQVKVGGVRVELEEVEAELGRAPGVAAAAVVARPSAGGDGSPLAAFVVPAAGAPGPRASALRSWLRERLPAAAVPRSWAFVAELPRGPSGKVDFGALAARAGEGAGPDPYAPRAGAGATLAALWARTLGAWPAPGDRFLDAGGDSVAALELVAAAEARGVALSAEGLFANPTFAELLAAPRRSAPAAATVEGLRADAASMLPAAAGRSGGGGPAGARPPPCAVVTGATGFFGAHLLAALAPDYEQIVCLVRAPDEATARARLAGAAARYGLPHDGGRVRALAGDAARPRFGLDERAWVALCEGASAVFHSAGVVNLTWPYERLRAPNVAAAGEALRLATEGAPKVLHHVSTLSVFVSAEPVPAVLREDDDPGAARTVYGGYAQSKWAAEHLLRLGARGGARVACYRLGLLTGAAGANVASAAPAAADQVSLVLAGLARLGGAPRERAGLRFDVTPVDYAAAALARIAGQARPEPGELVAFHLASERGASADALVDALRAEGVRVDDVGASAWRAVGARAGDDEAAAAAHLAFSRAGGEAAYVRQRPLELFQSTGFAFDDARARAALAGTGLACPPAGPALLRRYARAALGRGAP